MRNVFLWSLVAMVASAVTTAVVANYVQRHPTAALAQCVNCVTGSDAPCDGMQRVACQPKISLTPEATVQAMKDLGVSTALVDEKPSAEIAQLPSLPDLIPPPPEATSATPVTPPVTAQVPVIEVTLNEPVAPAGPQGSCPKCCVEGAPCCAQGAPCCVANAQVAALMRACQALCACGKFEEAQAVQAQIAKIDPNAAKQFTCCAVTGVVQRIGVDFNCEQLTKPPRVAAWNVPADAIVEVIVAPPRAVGMGMAPQFAPNFMQPLPPPPPMPFGFAERRVYEPAMPNPDSCGGCQPPACPPMVATTSRVDPRILAGLLGCQNGPTFLGRLGGKGDKCCDDDDDDDPEVTVETYDVSKFIDPAQGATEERLLQMISRMVGPGTWDEDEGGTMDVFPIGKILVVRTTPEIHEEMSKFLSKLETAVAASLNKAPAPALIGSAAPCCQENGTCQAACPASAAACCSAKMYRKVYPVGDLMKSAQANGDRSPEDALIHAMCQTVEPASWDATGGSAHVDYYPLGRALVVFQCPSCHERIQHFLDSMRELNALGGVVEAGLRTEVPELVTKSGIEVDGKDIEIEVTSPQDGKDVRYFRITDGTVRIRVKRREGIEQSGFRIDVDAKPVIDDRPAPGIPGDEPVKTPEKLPEAKK